jgi:hypothetical protein
MLNKNRASMCSHASRLKAGLEDMASSGHFNPHHAIISLASYSTEQQKQVDQASSTLYYRYRAQHGGNQWFSSNHGSVWKCVVS